MTRINMGFKLSPSIGNIEHKFFFVFLVVVVVVRLFVNVVALAVRIIMGF